VAGLRRPTPCPTRRAVPVVAFHGTADPVDSFAGHGQAYWTYSVPEATRLWAAQDGCAATPTTTRPARGATLTTYHTCRSGAVVELYAVSGEGHEWPGGPHGRVGSTKQRRQRQRGHVAVFRRASPLVSQRAALSPDDKRPRR
jgi:poly(3-hydroxybutyrate) depolymerase